MSIAAMKKINDAGIKCTVLTKGILPRSLEELCKENEYGITLVSLDEGFREKYEPHSASLQNRLNALKDLHEAGCKTWVSIEPYPTPNLVQQDLMALLEAVSFVDRIIFGRMNYNQLVSAFPRHKAFYNDCAALVSLFCRERGVDLHIKEGTMS